MVKRPYDIKEVADKLLDEFIETVESLDIPWWLFKGTCLGMVTVGGYYVGDSDIDIAIDCSDEDFQKLTEVLLNQGWTKRWMVGVNGFKQGVMGEHQKFCKHDIIFDVWSKRVLVKINKIYEKFLGKGQKIVYNGKEYNVPSPVEEFLDSQYANWRGSK